ncbi:HNH endonuclease [bacterium]|jgi:5-methylcytosine-specific restriction endonuclease McrA|nr:HNH endonuclease [bacterium]
MSSNDENKPSSDDYFILEPEFTDPKRVKKEREKARKLKKSQWWLTKINQGLCHYCGKKFPPKELTMDHVVPIARGGTSTPGNVVSSCKNCNRDKKLLTPAEQLMKQKL